MKKIVYSIILILISFQFSISQEYHFKFNIQSKEEIASITKIISIDNVKGNQVIAYANEAEFANFKTLGYDIEFIQKEMPDVINMATTVAQMASWDRYPTYEVYRQMMKNFEINYPNLCKLDSIGTTNNQRKIYVLKISDNVGTHEAEPEFFYTSSMHGDETTGFLLLLRLIDYLLVNYGTDAQVTNLVNNIEIYINPASNPDGTYYGGNSTVASSRRYNANGTDLNRDFPDPRSGANSPYEIETQTMMNFASAHKFIMSANFHGGAEVMNYPWDTWTSAQNPHADNDWFAHVSTDYVTEARLVRPTFMTDVTSSGVTEGGDWYVVDGGRQDYMNYVHHCKEICIEISSTKLLSTDQLNTYWNINKNSLLKFIEPVLYGFKGTVKNESNQPLNATITIANHDKDNSHTVTDPLHGDYYRPVKPGTYSVTYSAAGYISQTHSITVDNWTSSVIKDVVLIEAQTTTVTGTVTEQNTGNPLQGVLIQFIDTSIPTVTTNAQGQFSVPNVYESTYTIRASKEGYASGSRTVIITTVNNTVNFDLSVSSAISFESEIPTGWVTSGGANWFRDNSTAYDGTWSLRSGAISHSGSTVVQITKSVQSGEISFYKKVDTESGYDFVYFHIDNVEKGKWSGVSDWTQHTYPVTAGTHTFKWTYSKDNSSSTVNDCGWIDYVIFPPEQSATSYNVTFIVKSAGVGVSGANVALTGYGSQTTNGSGETVFTNVSVTPNPGIAYTVTASGYQNATGNVIVDGNVSVNVALNNIQTYTVTFNVTASGNPVNGANITLTGYGTQSTVNGSTLFTNVSATSTPGISYLITAQGYGDFTGSVVVENNVSLNIPLSPNAIVDDLKSTGGVNIYPNPSKGIFNVEISLTDVTKVELFDFSGRLVASYPGFESKTYIFDLQDKHSGIYFLRVQTSTQNVVRKMIID